MSIQEAKEILEMKRTMVLETLAGGLLDSGLIVQMGDGMHCRPMLGGFPPGSEWILALNGPGAKPGTG